MGKDPGMIGRLKSNWQEFAESKPGERFKDRYRRRQEDGPGNLISKIFWIVLGTVIALGSLFTAPLPGPGFATVFLGLAILGGEVLLVARFLDWSEVGLRRFWQFVKDVWGVGVVGKAVVVAVTAILVGAFVYVVYLLFFGR